jgi:hypothetical protein
MRKISLIAMSVAVGLAGCGGDSSDSTPVVETNTYTVTAIDGYLYMASVYADMDSDGAVTAQDALLGQTDANGQLKIADQYKSYPLIIQATAGETIDQTRGPVMQAFELRAPEGFETISPMTELVAAQLESNDQLSIEEAKNAIVSTVSRGALTVDAGQLFGDYIADIDTSDNAKAINAIGEALVDLGHSQDDLEADTLLQIVEGIADILETIIEDDTLEIADDFAPIIELPESGVPIIAENHRPTVDGSIASQSIILGDTITDIDVTSYFVDQDGDALTYQATNLPQGVSFIGDTLSGTPEQAGVFAILVTAKDEHNTTSNPTTFTLTVESPDQPPVVDSEEQSDLQSEVSAWVITEGSEVSSLSLDVTSLFIDDGEMSINANIEGVNGISASVEQGNVVLSGTPSEAGQTGTLVISAQDSVNIEVATAEFALPVVEEGTPVNPPVEGELEFSVEHFNNQVWKMGSFADQDGEIGYAALLNNNGNLEICWGDEYDQYKTNISYGDSYERLLELDQSTDYLNNGTNDCWSVTLTNGMLADEEGNDYELLYQHTTASGDYQLLVKIDGDELFWLDSTDTPFAQRLEITDNVKVGSTEYTLTVESSDNNDNEPALAYATGKYIYGDGTFENSSITPVGFYTPGTWSTYVDPTSSIQVVELVETAEDQKTRSRWLNREFGDFSIAVKWREDLGGYTSQHDYGLFSNNETAMASLIDQLPIINVDEDD